MVRLSHALEILIQGKDDLSPSITKIEFAMKGLKTYLEEGDKLSQRSIDASISKYNALNATLQDLKARQKDLHKEPIAQTEQLIKSTDTLASALGTLIEGPSKLVPILEKANAEIDKLQEKGRNLIPTDSQGILANEKAIERWREKIVTAVDDADRKASHMWDNPLEAAKAFETKTLSTLSLLQWAFEATFAVRAVKSILTFLKFLSKIPEKLAKIATQATIVGVTLLAAFSAASLASAKMAEEGEYAMDVFQSLAGDSAPELLDALRENSRFMINDTVLLETYNKAYMLVGDTIARRMPEAYNSLSRVAAAYGEDADYLMDRLYKSVGRLSTRWMAYIGTVVTVQEAEAEAAKMFNKSADALSYNEKQAGMMELTLARLAERAQDFPEVLGTTIQMSAALEASLTNLSNAYGEIFTPALRSGTQAALDWLEVIRSLISEGGGLYKFLRTMSATMSVLFDYLSALAGKFFDFEDDINDSVERMADNLIATAWKAFSWGFNIAAQIGIGLIEGAAKFITIAANFITGILTSWFAPGSPPKVAPNIDKWGALTMNEFLKGFGEADFDILEGTQRKLETVLGAMVNAGWLVKQEAAEIFLGISADMTKALIQMQDTGEVVDTMFSGLLQLEGPYGEALVKLTQLQIGYSEAVNRVKNATEALKAAEDELVASQDNLSRETDEYYMLLLTKASYAEIVAGKAEKKAAEQRNKYAKTNLVNAENEKEASEKNLEGLEDRLKLQGKLIDQLALLLTKQSEMLPDDAKTKAGKEPKAGAGGDAFEMPEIVLAGGIPKIDIDQAFEDLKARIKIKFDELWQGVVDKWEQSDAGKAIARMIASLNILGDVWTTIKTKWEPKVAWVFTTLGDIDTYLNVTLLEDLAKMTIQWDKDWHQMWKDLDTWWNKDLVVILEDIKTWFTITAPKFLADWAVTWWKVLVSVSTNTDTELGASSDFWDTWLGTIAENAISWWFNDLLPTLRNWWTYLTVDLWDAGRELRNQSETDVYPGISKAIISMAGTIMPILLTFSNWLGIDIPKAGKTMDKETQDSFISLFDFLTLWWTDDVQPILKDFAAWFAEAGDTAFLVVLEAFVIFFNLFFSPVVQLLDAAWIAADRLLGSLKTLLKWIQGNPLSVPIGADLDPNFENDSPLRIHTKLMDMDTWIKDNPMTVDMGLSETSNIAGSSLPAITGGNTFYIDNLILEGVQDKEGLLRQLEEAI